MRSKVGISRYGLCQDFAPLDFAIFNEEFPVWAADIDGYEVTGSIISLCKPPAV